jgi:hypothetical protein
MRHKTLAQPLFFGFHPFSLPKTSPSFIPTIPLPEGRAGTAWETSKPEIKNKMFVAPFKI